MYGKTKGEVQTKLRAIQSKADTGGIVDAPRETVGAFLTRWLDDVVRITLSPNTYQSYESVVRVHVLPQLGGVKLAKVGAAQVQAMHSNLEREGVQPRSRELAHALLRRALEQAVKWDLIRSNPCDKVERPRVPKRVMKTLTPQETMTLLATSRTSRLSALFVLAVATGMRQGELFALQWTDIDFDAATIKVQRSLEEIDGVPRLKEPKSAKSRRQIDLPAFAVEALRAHHGHMCDEGHAAAPVFCSAAGIWLLKSNFTRRVFKPALRAAGLPDVRFHDLRHGHATLMLGMGENPKVVQERLGHSQINLTLDTYSHVLPAVHRKAADNIDRAFRDLGA